MAGNIINAELKVDKEGKSRGMGIIQFEHPMEAVQAICILEQFQFNLWSLATHYVITLLSNVSVLFDDIA